ncbi:MAG: hypothetical protein JO112_11190, partial [Planctomycetes bacterium]|nr:hypothetical protein [Planctomycetota bacterium]
MSNPSILLVKGSGTGLSYANPDPTTGYYAPQDRDRNALCRNPDGSWTEVQPDAFRLHYRLPASSSSSSSAASPRSSAASSPSPSGLGSSSSSSSRSGRSATSAGLSSLGSAGPDQTGSSAGGLPGGGVAGPRAAALPAGGSTLYSVLERARALLRRGRQLAAAAAGVGASSPSPELGYTRNLLSADYALPYLGEPLDDPSA